MPLVIAAFLTLCFTQCYKERSCGATITCLYQPNDSTIAFAKGAVLSLDTFAKYNHVFYYDSLVPADSIRIPFTNPISDTLHHLFPYTLGENGTYSFQLAHPALLVLKADLIDTTGGINRKFVGYTQITLEEGILNKADTIMLELDD